MPAVAIPAAIAIAGMIKQHIDANNAQKKADAATAAAQQAAANDPRQAQLQSIVNSGASPDQMMALLRSGPNGPIGAAPTADISQFLNPNQDQIAAYQQRTPQEQAALSAMLGTGSQSLQQGQQLSQMSLPQLASLSKYNQAILGNNKAAVTSAIAPQAQQMAEVQQGARRGLEASGLRGGAKQQALAESARLNAGQIANLIPQAQQQARGETMQLGLGGQQLAQSAMGQAGQLFGGAQQAEQSNRQFGIGAEQANRQLGGALTMQQLMAALQGRGQDISFGQNLAGLYQGQRGQDIQALLGGLGAGTAASALSAQNSQNALAQTNAGNAGLGTFLNGLYQQYQTNKNSGAANPYSYTNPQNPGYYNPAGNSGSPSFVGPPADNSPWGGSP